MIIIIIIIIIIISFMQGIYTYIPETNHVPRQYSVSPILSLLFMVSIWLVPALALLLFYFKIFSASFLIIIIIIIIIIINFIRHAMFLTRFTRLSASPTAATYGSMRCGC